MQRKAIGDLIIGFDDFGGFLCKSYNSLKSSPHSESISDTLPINPKQIKFIGLDSKAAHLKELYISICFNDDFSVFIRFFL